MIKIIFNCFYPAVGYEEVIITRSGDTKILDLYKEKERIEEKGCYIVGINLVKL